MAHGVLVQAGCLRQCHRVWRAVLTSAEGVERVDATNEEQMRDLVKRSRVIISTLGPFSENGEVAFKVCAEEGKHYVDWYVGP